MRNRYLLVADLCLIALCATGAFILRLDWFFDTAYLATFQVFLGAALAVKPPVFMGFGLYGRFWRYATARDMLVIVLAVFAASLTLSVLMFVSLRAGIVTSVPRSVLFIDWVLTICCVGGLRFGVRLLSEPAVVHGRTRRPAAKRVLVAGAGDAGVMVAREVRRNPALGLSVVGFLDDQRLKIGKRIEDVPVLGPLADLEQVVEDASVDEVVIAMPTAPGSTVRDVVERCRRTGVSARSLPGLYELLEGKVSVARLRQVEIADLLRRAQVAPDPALSLYLDRRVVMVTGGGGSIGGELCRQVARAGARAVVLVGHGENSLYETEMALRDAHPEVTVEVAVADVRDRQRVRRLFDRHRPDVVFHAAAHKHVPLMELNPEEAVTNNVLGTRHVVEACESQAVERLVLISTDKAVAPTNVMGATKRVAEAIVLDAAARSSRRFAVVRFGNVLGSRGSVVPRFKAQIERGGPITLTHPDMTRFFMTIPEAVQLVIQAGSLAHGAELFVLNMGQPVRIRDLAEDLIRLSGLPLSEMPIVYTGLRPGEKLTENLWEEGATIVATGHPDILRVDERRRLAGTALRAAVDDLVASAASGSAAELGSRLLELVASLAAGPQGASGHDMPFPAGRRP